MQRDAAPKVTKEGSDLTVPNFALWDYLKEKVHVNEPQTLQQLKNNIRDEVRVLEPETLKGVMENAWKTKMGSNCDM